MGYSSGSPRGLSQKVLSMSKLGKVGCYRDTVKHCIAHGIMFNSPPHENFYLAINVNIARLRSPGL